MPRTFYIIPTRILGECWLPKPPVSSLKVRPSPFSRRPEMGIHLDLYVLLDQWPPIIYYLLCKWIWNAMAIHFYLSVPAFFMCQKKCVTATHLQSYKAKLNTLWPLQGKRRRGRLWRLPTCKKKKNKKNCFASMRLWLQFPEPGQKNLNLVTHVYNSSTGKAETSKFLEFTSLPA